VTDKSHFKDTIIFLFLLESDKNNLFLSDFFMPVRLMLLIKMNGAMG